MDTQFKLMKYHSDFLIGSTFRISSPIGNISITLAEYQYINDSDQAKRKLDTNHLLIGIGRMISIVNGLFLIGRKPDS
jgi:hypothetical protein